MFLTGFADEAGSDIETQIRATKELGWRHIESRNVGSGNIHDIPEDEFQRVCDKLGEAGVRINCFGSKIANWAKPLEKPDTSLEEAKRAVPRMQKLGVEHIRIMSYPLIKGEPPARQQAEERFRRLREIVKVLLDGGLTPLHENCFNYGGLGWTYTLELLEKVPGMKLVFDTGNPVCLDDWTKPPPLPKQSSWEFYQHVKEHVVYIHIKDGVWNPAEQKMSYTFAGEGSGDVRRILQDMVRSGYDGGVSIEPHLAVVAHDANVSSSQAVRYANYVEYGRRLQQMLEELGVKCNK